MDANPDFEINGLNSRSLDHALGFPPYNAVFNNVATTMTEIDLATLMAVSDTDEEDIFVGATESYGRLGIYGGHFVGQALAAGLASVDENKLANSFHCYFLNPGDPGQELRYQVTRLKEGRGFESRSITALQGDRAAIQMIASFKVPEDGDEHQKTMPEVISPAALAEKLSTQEAQFQPPMVTGGRAEIMRISDSFVPDTFTPGREPVLQTWMRSRHEKALSEREAQTVMAFLSDSTLMFNSVLPHGIAFQTHRLTSLDHAAWFHASCEVTDWMLFDQRSTRAGDGRGMNQGELYTLDGQLVMSTAQDSMLRRMT